MTTQKKVLTTKTDVKVSFGGKEYSLHNLGLGSINSLGNVINVIFGGMGGLMQGGLTQKESMSEGVKFLSQFLTKLNPEDIQTVVSDGLKISVEEVNKSWSNKEGMKVLSAILAQEDVQEIFLDLVQGIAPTKEGTSKA